MQIAKNLKLKSKLLISFLVVGLIPAITISWVALTKSSSAMRDQVFKQIQSTRETKASQIEYLFGTIQRQVSAYSKNVMTVEAMTAFRSQFQILEAAVPVEVMRASVAEFYKNDFATEYASRNGYLPMQEVDSMVSSFNDATLTLKYQYISNSPHPLGSKHLLDIAPDDSMWSIVHETYHPSLRSFLEEFGYYDVFLIDADTGYIVYSVFKEVDFATSLRTGPYANTNFARVFEAAAAAKRPGEVSIVDMEPYHPSYDAPAAFVAAPIFDGSDKIGVLVFQIPIDKIDRITTNEGKWKEIGFGDTGETYLVGQDHMMRSNSRFVVEDKDAFAAEMAAFGADAAQVKKILDKGTTVNIQEVNSELVDEALAGRVDSVVATNYRGNKVLSSFKPLNISGLKWVLMSEIEEEEAYSQVSTLQFLMMIIFSLSVVAIALFAIFISRSVTVSLTRSVRELNTSAGEIESASRILNSSSQELSARATQSAASLEETVASLETLSRNVTENSENSRGASDLSNQGFKAAQEGVHKIQALIQSMEEISSDSQKMEDIIGVIDGIAFQTNLLALNAAVEAARAGEQGKGFAVVAEAVRNLSQRSAQSAKDIAALIKESTTKIEASSDSAHSSGQALNKILDLVKEITDLNSRIAESSSEQASGISQISMAMNQLDKVAQANAASAEKTANSSERLEGQSNSIKVIVDDLDAIVEGSRQGSKLVS